jgi:hypothetical protein
MTTEPTTPPMAASNEAEPVRVRIDPPTWMRHDPVNGRRYERPVDVVFEDRRFTPGRKPSPDARPRGADSSYAGR